MRGGLRVTPKFSLDLRCGALALALALLGCGSEVPDETAGTDRRPIPLSETKPLVRSDFKRMPDWRQLADALGIESSVPEDQLLPKILERCEQLFVFDEKDLQVSQRSQIPQRDLVENRLLNLLVQVEQELGRQPPKDLRVLLVSRRLREELASLFPNGKFDPFGRVRGDRDWDAAAEFFQGFDRYRLAAWVEKMRNTTAQWRHRVPEETPTDSDRVFEALEEISSLELKPTRRRFFLDDDKWVIDIYTRLLQSLDSGANEVRTLGEFIDIIRKREQEALQRRKQRLEALQETLTP